MIENYHDRLLITLGEVENITLEVAMERTTNRIYKKLITVETITPTNDKF